jgi:hypothetical protein
METNFLTKSEREIFQKLPGPPVTAAIQVSNVWIIEWLSPNEKHTGRLLHEWINTQRPGWSAYSMCKTKQEVISAIERATNRAEQSAMVPILHLEAHGNEFGLAPNANANATEFLNWDELTEPLQGLNLATRCNLIVFVAACTGFAGILALVRGPRAPAIALVGPDANVIPRNLLEGTKEFYRRLMKGNMELQDIAANASQQAGTVFEPEPFSTLAYGSLVESQIISMRPSEQRLRLDRIRQLMLAENLLSDAEIEHRLTFLSPIPSAVQLQQIWDEMFMIDLYPENRERFSVDMNRIVELINTKGAGLSLAP